MLAHFNAETKYGWSLSRFTRHLKSYCEYAENISGFNPASVTGKGEDGMPWVKREGNVMVRYYYIASVAKTEKPADDGYGPGDDAKPF